MTAIDQSAFIRAAEAEATGETSPLKRAHRRVLEDPSSDFNREVYAEELDEVGEHERAEFVRVQLALVAAKHNHRHQLFGGEPCRACQLKRRERRLFKANKAGVHWIGDDVLECSSLVEEDVTWHRGFVSKIQSRILEFMGEPCACRKTNSGRIVNPSRRYGTPHCSACRGSGRSGGLVDLLFKTHPVKELFLTDREPHEGSSGWWWGHENSTGQLNLRHVLPYPLCQMVNKGGRGAAVDFPTKEIAIQVLSRSCVVLGRQIARLPELNWSPPVTSPPAEA